MPLGQTLERHGNKLLVPSYLQLGKSLSVLGENEIITQIVVGSRGGGGNDKAVVIPLTGSTWTSQLYKPTKFPLHLNYFKMLCPLTMENVLSKTHLQPYVIFEIIFKVSLKQCYTVMRNYCKYISFLVIIFLKNKKNTHTQHTEKPCRKR